MLNLPNAGRPSMLPLSLVLSLLTSWSVSRAENVLLVVVDDVGGDMSTSEGYPVTPRINSLATQGVRFNNAWATPLCSPTRATILTGRYPFRTGTRNVAESTAGANVLPRCELTIPEVLDLPGAGGATHAAVGKWHLGDWKRAPNDAGFRHVVASANNGGSLINLNNYFSWTKIIDGTSTSAYTGYVTVDNVADAKTWIDRRGSQPWFVYLAFNAPHKTGVGYHRPKTQQPPLYSQEMPDVCFPDGSLCDGQERTCQMGGQSFHTVAPPPSRCYKAMLEVVDYELDWLLDQVDPNLENTTVIFIGDNGTPNDISGLPAGRGKGSLYESGIRVPLIIAGSQVTTTVHTSNALVHSVDLFATAIELISGAALSSLTLPGNPAIDSKSLVPILNDPETAVRSIAYTQVDGDVALRMGDYKLIINSDSTPAPYELYDLQADPQETNNLYPGEGSAGLARQQMFFYYDSLTVTTDDCDGDEVPPQSDNCDESSNVDQVDSDGDGVGNPCDSCPSVSNSSQTPPAVTVVWPNGGNTLTVGQSVNLQWAATHSCASVSTVDVFISRDGVNGTYEQILNDTPNDGSQSWTVTGPAAPGFNVVMMVVAQDPVGRTGSDTSNSGFRIAPPPCGPCSPSSYCLEEGIRCTWNNTCGTGGCCNYSCTSDPTCAVADECPGNACVCLN